MFDWFRNLSVTREYTTWKDVPDWNKVNDDMNKVIPFPEVTKTPPMPEVEPPKEKPAHTYYRLGLTDNNRVSFTMGYSELTLSAVGVDNLIAQLEVFRNQLQVDSDE